MRTPSLLSSALLAIPLVVLPLCGAVAPHQSGSHSGGGESRAGSRELLQGAVDDVLRSSESARRALVAIPRRGFDRSALLAELGAEPEALHAWVRDHTRWAPYRGALRGPRGVQMEGLGNALDRSLFLADLLEAAGHRVRLARAELTEERARELWRELAALATSAEQSADAALDSAGIGGDGAALQAERRRGGLAAQEQREEALMRILPQAGLLAELVATSPPGGGDAQLAAQARAALRDHWWVQLETAGGWLDLDPAAPAGVALAEARETCAPGALPGELEHRLRVALRVERLSAGALTRETVLSEELRPRERLGETVVLQIVPMASLTGGASGAGDDELLAQEEWLPILVVGERSVVQSSFRLSGEVERTPLLDPGQRRVDGFSDLLGSLGETSPASTLSRVWIEYAIESPAGSRQVERVLYDLLAPEERAAAEAPRIPELERAARLERALALLTRTEILPLAGRLSAEWVTARVLEAQLGNRLPVLGVLQALMDGEEDALRARLASWRPVPMGLYALALARSDWSPHAPDVFLDRIDVLTSRVVFQRDPAGSVTPCVAIDIVANEVAVLPFADLDPWRARLVQGVVDTNAEALLISASGIPVERNAAEDMRADLAHGVEWVALHSAAGPEWEAARWSPHERARMAAELEAGYVVVAPSDARGRGALTWWRVDPRTGATLGFDARGWGCAQESAEYTTILREVPLKVAVWMQENKTTLIWFCMACAVSRRLLPLLIPEIPPDAIKAGCQALCLGIGENGPWT